MMSTAKTKPIIFMVYANDRNDQTNYLRQLDEEARRVRNTLVQAEDALLAEVIVRQNAIAEEILDIFQYPDNSGRIAIFHFGGHANGYELLLESLEGHPSVVAADGLAVFLAHQKNLKLVFLNGCSTQQQVNGLLEAGIPVVIATSQAINDQVATDFSSLFYSAIVDGMDIRIAFDYAVAQLNKSSTENQALFRHFHLINHDSSGDTWPWDLYIRQGAALSATWNLPEAANMPLYGLPPLPSRALPENPFRHLHWFAAEHADVFFGRGYEIRKLYNLIVSSTAAPIILFYGQSGVGKSSLLNAGLFPRISQKQEIFYLRRQELSLNDTLRNALELTTNDRSIQDAWVTLEEEVQRPLTIILDQVEYALMESQGDTLVELATFWDGLCTLFGDPQKRPNGRLILGFRKEWLSPVEERLKEYRLPYESIFLEPLSRQGIIEAVEGVAKTAYLQDYYGLTVEEDLARIVADDLLEDQDSVITPTLQILLTKMWELASEEKDRPCFTHQQYQKLRRAGVLLRDFVDQQLAVLQQQLPDASHAGLILDFLAYHTTTLGASSQKTLAELQAAYCHQVEILPVLLQSCQDLYLLIQVNDPTQKREPSFRLAHDALAPYVRKLFDESDRPGQRAYRLLRSQIREEQNGDKILLDEGILRLIEQGHNGMHTYSSVAQQMLERSRAALEQFRPRPLEEGLFPPELRVKEYVADVWLVIEYGVHQEIIFDLREQITKTKGAPIKDAIKMTVESASAGEIGTLQYSDIVFYRSPPQETRQAVIEMIVPFYLSLNNALGHTNIEHPFRGEPS